MRSPERALGHKSPVSAEAGNGVDLACLKRFLTRHRRKDSRHCLGQRRLARAGRPDHNHVMSSRGGYLHAPLGSLLPDNLSHVHNLPGTHAGGFLSKIIAPADQKVGHVFLSGNDAQHFRQASDTIDVSGIIVGSVFCRVEREYAAFPAVRHA